MRSSARQLIALFGLLSGVSLALFLFGALQNREWTHFYLFWNLFLAWLPLLLALLLREQLKTQRWSSWLPLVTTFAWLGFLPNTFYMVTDYIHLQDVARVDIIFDTVMFTLPIATAFGLGLVSMYLVHQQLQRRMDWLRTWRVMSVVALLSGFAIYIGRFLRWNTWDMITNPSGILFDLSDMLIQPFAHLQMVTTTVSFFVLIMAGYVALRWGVRVSRR